MEGKEREPRDGEGADNPAKARNRDRNGFPSYVYSADALVLVVCFPKSWQSRAELPGYHV